MKRASKFLVSIDLFRSKWFKIGLSVFLFLSIAAAATILYNFSYYSRIIDRRLSGEIFEQTVRFYAAPYHVYPGQAISRDTVISRLQRAGLEPAGTTTAPEGVYEVKGQRLTVRPFKATALRLEWEGATLARVVNERQGEVGDAELPAELLTTLSNENREKRRIVTYAELPKPLVNALISAEDQRFRRHHGLDYIRIVGAMISNIRHSDRLQGGSTITQQLARNFFLTSSRTVTRKLNEAFIAMLLEQRLSKDQILTMYANEVYLGQRGSFSIHGFAEGAAAFFGKDLTALTLSEAATLAGIIPAPNTFSPTKYPENAKKRRNLVLNAMRELNYITAEEFEHAKAAPLVVVPARMDASDAPYMVDLARDELLKNFSEEALINDGLRVYTTIDPGLQRAAVEAVETGLKGVWEIMAKRNKGKKNADKLAPAQAALIVVNPHTGAILAGAGGSDYATSQLNRITQANRQPGSIFKAFVYAAALEASERHPNAPEESSGADDAAALEPAAHAENESPEETRDPNPITALTLLEDVPTTFLYDNGRKYEPNNYHEEYKGQVTLRYALEHSLNVPTIKLAERIGYDRVVLLAKRAGLNAKIKAYPSVALGAFEVTPLEMAGAYTIFANGGKRVQPHALIRVVNAEGKAARNYTFPTEEVLSPQVAYLMTHLMEGVIREGTGASVRGRGFALPAAGKTGTSRDGWFAGYTKDLLAIAWVGFDDNRDLNLEGAHSALPIWTEFMKKATALYPPRDTTEFEAPSGIKVLRVDRQTRALANAGCPDTYEEAFLEDVVPSEHCPVHGPSVSEMLERGAAKVGGGVVDAFKGIGKAIGGVFH